MVLIPVTEIILTLGWRRNIPQVGPAVDQLRRRFGQVINFAPFVHSLHVIFTHWFTKRRRARMRHLHCRSKQGWRASSYADHL